MSLGKFDVSDRSSFCSMPAACMDCWEYPMQAWKVSHSVVGIL